MLSYHPKWFYYINLIILRNTFMLIYKQYTWVGNFYPGTETSGVSNQKQFEVYMTS